MGGKSLRLISADDSEYDDSVRGLNALSALPQLQCVDIKGCEPETDTAVPSNLNILDTNFVKFRRSRLLITEDERIIAIDMQRRLERAGYEVVGIAASVEQELEMIEETFPDIVLSGISLIGDTDGITGAEIIRRRFGIPVIYVTAMSHMEIISRAMRTCPSAYIIKVARDPELIYAIELELNNPVSRRGRKRDFITSVLEESESSLITVDNYGNIIFKNKASSALSGDGADAEDFLEEILPSVNRRGEFGPVRLLSGPAAGTYIAGNISTLNSGSKKTEGLLIRFSRWYRPVRKGVQPAPWYRIGDIPVNETGAWSSLHRLSSSVSMNILIAASDLKIAEDLKRRLERYGFNVAGISGSIQELSTQIRNNAVDSIILDTDMGLSDEELLALGTICSGYRIPVIALADSKSEIVQDLMKKVKASGIILKPFRDKQLYTHIHISEYCSCSRHSESSEASSAGSAALTLNRAVKAVNEGGYIQFINDKAKRLTGRKADNSTGLHLSDVFRLHGKNDLSSLVVRAKSESVKSFGPIRLDNGRCSPVCIAGDITLLSGEHGRPEGYVIIFDYWERRSQGRRGVL